MILCTIPEGECKLSLIGEERKQQIIDLLDTKGSVTTAELVGLFDVSKETVRRYLDELEASYKLKKVYGGAVKITHREEPSHLTRMTLHREQKNKIGRLAAGLVQDGDVLFLDEGTTPLAIIPYLDQRELVVLTNSFPAAALLMERMNQGKFAGRALFIGGEISAKHARCSGSVSESILDRYYVDKAFISVDGLHPEAGLSSMDDGKAAISRKAVTQAGETIVAADSSKLGLRFPYIIGGLRDVSRIVVDQAPSGEWLEAIRHNSVQWITAGDDA